jgi:hypothetical protein
MAQWPRAGRGGGLYSGGNPHCNARAQREVAARALGARLAICFGSEAPCGPRVKDKRAESGLRRRCFWSWTAASTAPVATADRFAKSATANAGRSATSTSRRSRTPGSTGRALNPANPRPAQSAIEADRRPRFIPWPGLRAGGGAEPGPGAVLRMERHGVPLSLGSAGMTGIIPLAEYTSHAAHACGCRVARHGLAPLDSSGDAVAPLEHGWRLSLGSSAPLAPAGQR